MTLVVSRAVAPMSRLMEWCLPLTKAGGYSVAYKSADIQAEMQEALPVMRKQGAELPTDHTIPIPHTEISRTLIRVRRRPVSNRSPIISGRKR